MIGDLSRRCGEMSVVAVGVRQLAVVWCAVHCRPFRWAGPVKRAATVNWPHFDYLLMVCWVGRLGLVAAMLHSCQVD